MSDNDVQRLPFGADDLRLPDALRGPLRKHLAALKANYLKRGWGMRVGWGERPALIVIDMARYWLDPELQIGSNLDSVMEGTCQVLAAARRAAEAEAESKKGAKPSGARSSSNSRLRMLYHCVMSNCSAQSELIPRSCIW